MKRIKSSSTQAVGKKNWSMGLDEKLYDNKKNVWVPTQSKHKKNTALFMMVCRVGKGRQEPEQWLQKLARVWVKSRTRIITLKLCALINVNYIFFNDSLKKTPSFLLLLQ